MFFIILLRGDFFFFCTRVLNQYGFKEENGLARVKRVDSVLTISRRGIRASSGAREVPQRQKLSLSCVQGLVQRGEMVPDPRVHRQLLLRFAGDRCSEISQHSKRDAQREASFFGFQSGPVELGG